jgi:hypothetical protein
MLTSDPKRRTAFYRYYPLVAVVAVLVFAVVLVFQHWLHVWLWLPYALILLCPLMMFFMMRGMNEPKTGAH